MTSRSQDGCTGHALGFSLADLPLACEASARASLPQEATHSLRSPSFGTSRSSARVLCNRLATRISRFRRLPEPIALKPVQTVHINLICPSFRSFSHLV